MGIFDFLNKGKKGDSVKRTPDFSNVRAGSSTTAPPMQSPAPEPGFTEYRVVKGDSLSAIAKRHYGDAQAWRTIFEANRDIIKDPDLIHPGQVLKLPKLH